MRSRVDARVFLVEICCVTVLVLLEPPVDSRPRDACMQSDSGVDGEIKKLRDGQFRKSDG